MPAAFGALVLAQAAHSTEEVMGRLWESFPPARFVAGLVSDNLERGFLLVNVWLVAIGIACYFGPVRQRWPVAIPILWLWVVIETINGLGHPLWTLMQRGYTPGVITALLLLPLALNLAWQVLASSAREAARRPE